MRCTKQLLKAGPLHKSEMLDLFKISPEKMLLKNVRDLRTYSGGTALQYYTCFRHFRKFIAVLETVRGPYVKVTYLSFIITNNNFISSCLFWEMASIFRLLKPTFYVQLHELKAVFILFVFVSESNPYVVSNTFYDNVIYDDDECTVCYIFKTQ